MTLLPVLIVASAADVSTIDVVASCVWRAERLLHSQRDRSSLNNLRSSLTYTNDLQLITRIRRQHLLVMSVILPFFKKPGCSVPCSQKPSNGTFPEPDESNPRLRILLLNIHFNIILPCRPTSSKWYPSGFSAKILYEFLITHTLPHASPFQTKCLQSSALRYLSYRVGFVRWGVVVHSPNFQSGISPLVSPPRLLIRHVLSYPPYLEVVLYTLFNKNQATWNFLSLSLSQAVTWRTVAIIIQVVLVSPYLCIRGIYLSSIHYKQSRRVYINQKHQYNRLIWSSNMN